MRVNILLAGLHKENVDFVLKRMEAMLHSLENDLVIYALNFGASECQADLQNWLGCYEGSRLYQVEAEPMQLQHMLAVADVFCGESDSNLILAAPTDQGKRLGQRLAAKRGLDCLTDVTGFEYVNQELRAVRKIYSTHIEGLFPAEQAVIAVSQSGEKHSYEEKANVFPVEMLVYGDGADFSDPDYLISEEILPQAEDLSKAKVVFLGGKGLGTKDNYERMEALAKKLGASCGCTRAVAMAGWASYDQVVGISGWKLQADVCIAFGVSGAGPLLQGLESVGKLTAINNDKKAPIFRHADYGVIEDCVKILDAMESAE